MQRHKVGNRFTGANTGMNSGATGSRLSISEAARRAGVSRVTLHRKISTGKISKAIDENGEPYIDLSELARVYPSVLTPPPSAPVAPEQPEHVSGSQVRTGDEAAALQRENNLLREALEDARKERDRLLGIVEQQTRLIADQRPKGGFLGLFRRP